MSAPVSGSGSGPQKPIEPPHPRTGQPAAQQEGAASEPPTQPALGGLRVRPGNPAQSRGATTSSPPEMAALAAHAHPDAARTAQRGGVEPSPRLSEKTDALAGGTNGLRWVTDKPNGSFIPEVDVVLGPERHNTVVGVATDEGRILDKDGNELTVHEAMTLSFRRGWGSEPFYLAIDGAEKGGAASLAQQWATISGAEVIAQQPVVGREKGMVRRTIVTGVGPRFRFSPGQFETPPARLAVENGELVELLKKGRRATEPLAHLREKLGSGEEGVVFRMGKNLAAKVFVPHRDEQEAIKSGWQVLERRANEGFRVEKKLGDLHYLPSGFAIQYRELGVASDRDILHLVRMGHDVSGSIEYLWTFVVEHERAQTLGRRTIAELDKMRDLFVTHRPFHHDPDFNDPKIMFDLKGLPYLYDPVRDTTRDFDRDLSNPDELHKNMLAIIAELREVAQARVSARRKSATR